MSLLELNQIEKNYRGGNILCAKEIHAVRGITLQVEQGECLAIVGESGSGKSTLGRMVVGLENPDRGQVIYDGKVLNANKITRKTRQELQMVYQNSYEATNPRFTAWDVVEEPIRYFKLLEKSRRGERVAELLKKVGIDPSEACKKTTEFSGGQLQRICIARALAAEAKLIVLDEPLSGLDISVQAQILNLLKNVKKEYGLSYLFISHDIEAVYNLADRLVVMYNGKVIEEIRDMSLFQKMSHPYTSLLLGKDMQDEKESWQETGERGCSYAQRCYNVTAKCHEIEPILQEIEKGHNVACHLGGTRNESK